jgi:hypothetical protein
MVRSFEAGLPATRSGRSCLDTASTPGVGTRWLGCGDRPPRWGGRRPADKAVTRSGCPAGRPRRGGHAPIFCFQQARFLDAPAILVVLPVCDPGWDNTIVNRRITGFHQDDEAHWVAELECGHGQHVRHDPPWQVRIWVTTPEGRAGRLGSVLNCVRCDDHEPDAPR